MERQQNTRCNTHTDPTPPNTRNHQCNEEDTDEHNKNHEELLELHNQNGHNTTPEEEDTLESTQAPPNQHTHDINPPRATQRQPTQNIQHQITHI